LTGLAHLRSEFPSRKTGLTADPKTLLNRFFISFSFGVYGLGLYSGILKPFYWSSVMATFN